MTFDPQEVLRITGPTFTAIVQLNKRGVVWWAAPAVRQMERWNRAKLLDYCKDKSWGVHRAVHNGWEEVIHPATD